MSTYFQEQNLVVHEQKQRKFSHYVIFKGIKVGLFNKWESVAPYIQCPHPIFKGYCSFDEAIRACRDAFGIKDFYIEPEETKTYSDIAKISHEQLIKAQENMIVRLQKQLLEQGQNTENSMIQLENRILQEKENILLEKINTLQEKLETKEKETGTNIYRDFNSFKARMLDIPWQQTMKPLIEDFQELEPIIEDKVRREFPLVLFDLQSQLTKMAYQEPEFKGVEIVQRRSSLGMTHFLLQINLEKTDMPEDQIINFYHNGMIDYLEFGYTHKVELLLNKLGEKLVFVAGNIASYSFNSIGCKIFSSFPEMDSHTYRPSRKRIFISEVEDVKKQIRDLACERKKESMNISWWLEDDFCPVNLSKAQQHQLEYNKKQIRDKWIIDAQKTPKIPMNFPRSQYKLLAEGHYIQIWGHHNWSMFLPFVGESDQLEQWDITNDELDAARSDGERYESDHNNPTPISPVSIDSTHRDF